MRGFFHVPPPTRIGGAQPYAPRLGIVQSGPDPQNPPKRGALAVATLAVVVGAWQAPPVRAQTAPKIAPLIPAQVVASKVPYSRAGQQQAIESAWRQSALVVLGGTQVAPLIAEPPTISDPPRRSDATLHALLRSWQPAFIPSQGYAELVISAPAVSTPLADRTWLTRVIDAWRQQPAFVQPRPAIATQPIVDNPPRKSYVNATTILQAWVPPFIAAQGYAEFAPLAPVVGAPDAPPIPGRVNEQIVRTLWIPPWYPPQGFSTIAPVLPRVDDPQRSSRVNLGTIIAAWTPPFIASQGYAELVLERLDAPPALTRQNFDVIARQWEPRWTGPEQVKFAPLAPPPVIPDDPPRRTWENFQTVIAQWEVTWTPPPPVSIASILPPPQPTQEFTRMVIVIAGETIVVVGDSDRTLQVEE